jgi:hypothetical protein
VDHRGSLGGRTRAHENPDGSDAAHQCTAKSVCEADRINRGYSLGYTGDDRGTCLDCDRRDAHAGSHEPEPDARYARGQSNSYDHGSIADRDGRRRCECNSGNFTDRDGRRRCERNSGSFTENTPATVTECDSGRQRRESNAGYSGNHLGNARDRCIAHPRRVRFGSDASVAFDQTKTEPIDSGFDCSGDGHHAGCVGFTRG